MAADNRIRPVPLPGPLVLAGHTPIRADDTALTNPLGVPAIHRVDTAIMALPEEPVLSTQIAEGSTAGSGRDRSRARSVPAPPGPARSRVSRATGKRRARSRYPSATRIDIAPAAALAGDMVWSGEIASERPSRDDTTLLAYPDDSDD